MPVPDPSAQSLHPRMHKRSITLAGHQTSIALETVFWQALDDLATQRGISTARLIQSIDQSRTASNLSSAIRVTLLEDLQCQLAASVRRETD